MRKYVIEQMNKGVSLEDIHIAVEKLFNEEYNKREQEQKEKKIAAVRERAVHAVMDYINAVWEDLLDCEVTFTDVSIMVDDIAAEYAPIEEEDEEEDVIIRAYRNGKEDPDAENALREFLCNMGLLSHK